MYCVILLLMLAVYFISTMFSICLKSKCSSNKKITIKGITYHWCDVSPVLLSPCLGNLPLIMHLRCRSIPVQRGLVELRELWPLIKSAWLISTFSIHSCTIASMNEMWSVNLEWLIFQSFACPPFIDPNSFIEAVVWLIMDGGGVNKGWT